jgi:hypothetical protein
VTVAAGAVRSTVIVADDAGELLPAWSTAIAVTVAGPSATAAFHGNAYGTAPSRATSTPRTVKSTWSTPI